MNTVNPQELIGEPFGRLTIVAVQWRALTGYRRRQYLIVRCVCGVEKTALPHDVVSGKIKSCGCFHREAAADRKRTHGEGKNGEQTPEFQIWHAMIQRCTNPNCKDWGNYGGRGIGVCAAWRDSYEAFLADVGRRPSADYSIDRFPNNDGNYEPGNVRWATKKEQRANQRRTV